MYANNNDRTRNRSSSICWVSQTQVLTDTRGCIFYCTYKREALKATGVEIGKAWLFFGCRHPDKDYLYKCVLTKTILILSLYSRSEIEGFLASGNLTHLHVSFSRLSEERYIQEGHVKYVQENMRRHWELLGRWIMEEHSVTYVCG